MNGIVMTQSAATVTIVFHSGYGHTKVQAEAVHAGATSVPGATVHLVSVDEIDAHWDRLDEADAIVFGTPTYMAGPSAAFKAFMDATSGRWAEHAWKDKLAAGFTNSAGINGDKLNTLESIALYAMQHGMVWVGLGLLPGNITAEGSPEDLNRLAGFIGAMAQSNADVGPDVAPAGSDLRTAAELGRRVAEAARRWRTGSPAAAEDELVAR
jgi:multimeric flavodoxin WrbA